MTPLALIAIAVVLAILAILTRLRPFPDDGRRPARGALLTSCLSLGTGLALQLPIAHDNLNGLVGWNISWPLQHALALVSAGALQVYLLYTVEEDPVVAAKRSARRGGPLVAAIAMMTTAFCIAPRSPAFALGPHGQTEISGIPTAAPVAAFLVFAIYLGYSSLLTTYLFWRWGMRARRGTWLRRGLWTIAAGCLATAAFAIHTVLSEAVPFAGGSLPWNTGTVENWLIPLAGALYLGGMCTSVVHASALWWRRYTDRRALFPLWKAFYRAMPTIAFTPPRFAWGDRIRFRRSEFYLYRTVIELGDGRRNLHPLIPQPVLEAAERAGQEVGLDGVALDALVEAVGITVGLRAWSAGAGTTQTATVGRPRGTGQLETEVIWWRHVVDAYHRRPLVNSIVITLTESREEQVGRTLVDIPTPPRPGITLRGTQFEGL